MKISVCGGLTDVRALLTAGFERIELPVFALFDESINDLSPQNGHFETYNCFVPAALKVTGPNVDREALRRHVSEACSRMGRLGGKLIVFGSGAARGTPEGYPRSAAKEETVSFLRDAAVIADAAGMRIAVEPLNRRECNWINSVDEACGIADAVDHPAVGVLSDLFHVAQENESYEGTARAGSHLIHVHIASPVTRAAPAEADIPELTAFFRAVKAAGYDGRVGLECSWKDIAAEGPAAIAVVERAWDAAN